MTGSDSNVQFSFHGINYKGVINMKVLRRFMQTL